MSLLALTSSDPDSKPDFRHPHDFPNSSLNAPSSFKSSVPPDMTTNPHRGLPPPGAISLPDPTRPSPAAPQPLLSTATAMAALPAPPTQWHGAEDSMRAWLAAKMEDDKRRQEELKLEQRRLEDRMLRDAYQSAVPPHLIPVIFAGLSGGPLASASLDIAQQHLAQAQHPAYAAQTSPDMRQDPRMAPQQPYLSAQLPQQQAAPPSHHQPPPPPPPPPPQAQAGQGMAQSQHGGVYSSASYQSSPQSRSKTLYGPPIQQYAPHTSSARVQSSLPRLSTNEPASTSGYGQQQEQGSPSSSNIYFHHWQPPAPNAKELKDASKPPTNPPWRISGQDFSSTSSPRGKRKATGQHEPRGPPPTSNPAASTSPTYSAASSGSGKSHQRQHSRESATAAGAQRKAYDVIERRNRRDEHEPGSRDNSTSGRSARSEPVSRHETPKDDDTKQPGDR